MAWDPCVSCGREFHGGTTFSYVTWHVGEDRFAFRLRQCSSCAADLRTSVSGTGDKRDEDGIWVSLVPRRGEPGLPAAPAARGSRSLKASPSSAPGAARADRER